MSFRAERGISSWFAKEGVRARFLAPLGMTRFLRPLTLDSAAVDFSTLDSSTPRLTQGRISTIGPLRAGRKAKARNRPIMNPPTCAHQATPPPVAD